MTGPRKLLFATVASGALLAVLELAGRLALPEPIPDIRQGTAGNLLPYDPDTRIVAEYGGGRRGVSGGGTLRQQSWTVPAERFRIAVAGDSTVHGPFTDVLDAGLDFSHETLNFGVYGIGSDRTRILARAALEQDLDLLVVYTGHNEFLEARLNPRSLTSFEERGRWTFVTRGGIARFLRLLSPPTAPSRRAGPDPAEYEPIGGDEETTVLASYRRNLEGICADAATAGVPVAFVAPVSSLLRPPEHGPQGGLDGFLLGSWGRLQREPGITPEALSQGGPPLDAVAEAYLAGLAALARGDRAGAESALIQARELDPHRWRVSKAMKAVLAEVASGCGATAIDPEPAMLADPRMLDPTDPLFVDQVHPSATGVRVLAPAVAAGLAPLLPAGATWKEPAATVGGDPSRMSPEERGYRLPSPPPGPR